jgi:hypothetical protein
VQNASQIQEGSNAMRIQTGILFTIAAALALGASAGAQATGTVRMNTLTQSVGQTPALPEPTVKADGDKTLTGEIPLDTPGANDPKDVSAVSSPVPASRGGLWIKPGTALSLQMDQPVSSGKHGNGTLVDGILLQPVRMANGALLPKGTPVKATVLAAAPAGKIQSAGVLSLEVVRVGAVAVNTNVLEFTGQPGKADVADANPEKGTEAMVQPGAMLQFKVLGAGDTWDSSQQRGSKPKQN